MREVRVLCIGSFIDATEVALHSFRRTNPWFDGYFRVYTTSDEVSTVSERLHYLDDVEIAVVDSTFVSQVQQSLSLTQFPEQWVTPRFFTLAMFGDMSADDVLIIDADVLFTGSIEDLTTSADSFVASADAVTYGGHGTHRITNEAVRVAGTDEHGVIERTFNSGVMRVSPEHLGPETLQRACSYLNPDILNRVTRRQHDQFVLNRLFEDRWTDSGPQLNYLLRCPREIFEQSGLRLNDAKVLHFNCDPRPWNVERLHEITDPVVARAVGDWHRSLATTVESRAVGRTVRPS